MDALPRRRPALKRPAQWAPSSTGRKRPAHGVGNAQLELTGSETPSSMDSVPIVSLEQIANARGPCQELLRLASTTCEASLKTLQRRTQQFIYKEYNTETLHGRIGQTLSFNRDGKTLKLYYANPMAMLSLATESSPPFADFLLSCLGPARVGHIFLYMDATKPGNALRPDSGRTYVACYWTLKEYPSFFRAREHFGWFTLGLFHQQDMKDFGFSDSELAKELLRCFWSDAPQSFNFSSTGIRIRHSSGDMVHIRMEFGGFLNDAKGHSDILGHNGASATKPCLSCLNVLGRVSMESVRPDGYFCHIKDPNCSKCVLATVNDYDEIVRLLREAHATGDEEAMKDITQKTGIKYEPRGLLFDDNMREVAQVPLKIYWDSQHAYFASGGLAQYQCNQLVRNVKRLGWTLEDLDEFAQSIKPPRSTDKLRKRFFQTRIRLRDGKKLKAFAGETLSVISVLGYFCDAILKPRRTLESHTRCFDLLRLLTDIILLGDRALEKGDLLQRTQCEHMKLFSRLYPKCVKNKMHTSWHVPQCMFRFGCNLTCFGPERKHRSSKTVASFTFRNIGKALLASEVHAFFKGIRDPSVFLPVFLCPPVLEAFQLNAMLGCAGLHVFYSSAMSSARGRLHKNDVLLWRDPTGICAGKALMFIRARSGPTALHAVFASQFIHIAGPVYSDATAVPKLVAAECVLKAVSYQQDGHEFTVLCPSVL